MIVDTSAIIAILFREEGYAEFIEALSNAAGQASISAATLLETGIVAKAANEPRLMSQLRELIQNFSITVVPFTEELAWQAIEAHREFGKGSGHPARLNFGDCFAYALAKAQGEPLLFKGKDFGSTDIGSAV